jgi:peptidoglycan/LPS O-acetylase OafA/YrhL
MYEEKYRYFKFAYFTYLTSRIWRLLPIYFVVFLIACVCTYFVPAMWSDAARDFKDFGTQNIIAPNVTLLGLANTPFQLIVPAWSLDVELQFYILAPLLLLICTGKNKLLPLICSLLLSLVLLVKYHKQENILVYLPWFLIGGLIYLLKYRSSKNFSTLALMLFIGTLGLHYAIPSLRQLLFNREPTIGVFTYYDVLNVGFAVFTIPFLSINISEVTANRQKDALYSSMSYVIYLLHWPFLMVYSDLVKGQHGLHKLAYLVLYYAACLLGSWIISRYVDDYFESGRRSWLKSNKVAQREYASFDMNKIIIP